MKYVKPILSSVVGIVVTSTIILFTYIVVGNALGTLLFIIGSLILLTSIIHSLTGVAKGRSRLLKSFGRFNFFMLLTYCLAVSIILIITWSANIILEETFGELSASEKISLIHSAMSSNENEIHAFTEDYPELKTDHITFRYHPDTEKSVEGMVASLGAIEQLEKDMYRGKIKKNDPLEVLVLKNADDFNQLNLNNTIENAGIYNPNKKRVMLYQGGVSGMEDEIYGIETFVHEYSHYLFDLFLEAERINTHDIPVWYNEGIAEFMRSRIISNMRMPGERESFASYLELHTHDEWDRARLTNDVYYQAYLAIEYIVAEQGNASVLSDILINQQDTGDFSQTFSQMTGYELTDFHQTVYSTDQKLTDAWNTWALYNDFEQADSIYKEILKKLPFHRSTWHQYALMLEEEKNWDEALAARREYIRINADAAGFINISYLLVLTDSQAALETAVTALEAAEKEPFETIVFFQQWVKDVSHYHQLITEGKYSDAYDSISQSDHLSYQQALLEELTDRTAALENKP